MNNTQYWHYAELDRQLKNMGQDSSLTTQTIFLSNPEQKKWLDELIIKYFYPILIEELQTENLTIAQLSKKDENPKIEDKQYVHTARCLNFVVHDPNKIDMANLFSPLWNCRGEIICTMFDYRICFDFSLCIPETFSIDKIISLIKCPAFSGLPPTLSYESNGTGNGFFDIVFQQGYGAGWLLENYKVASEQFRQKLKENIVLIQMVNKFETDLSNDTIFYNIVDTLIETYKSS